MLRQILDEMYIDPDVLEALNEDQKKTLFFKMREEQVRRWKEREEKLESEGGPADLRKPRTKKAKSVSWQLGRDGDLQVYVIGEVDELRSSKLIYSGLGERKASSLLNKCIQSSTLKSNLVNRTLAEPVRPGRENLPPKTQTGIELNLKENTEEVRTLPPLQVSVSEQTPSTPGETADYQEPKEEPDSDSDSPVSLSSICYKPHLRHVPTAPLFHRSHAPQEAQDTSGTHQLSVTSRLHPQETAEVQSSRGKDFRVVPASKRGVSEEDPATEDGDSERWVGRGRVAQLMKTFSISDAPAASPLAVARPNKPPLPSKPSHLRLHSAPSLR
ncbi:SH2 domain-containing protein 4A [Denticeps clupeoides]|uniref:Uncharacterized protein n=1 Tax=Denticeps clupeoides TaxID=299321 RepID=A0AAY4AE99_9TELE|nr:SH2 domain-containing protein 4A-like [Denticeps clupeoides]